MSVSTDAIALYVYVYVLCSPCKYNCSIFPLAYKKHVMSVMSVMALHRNINPTQRTFIVFTFAKCVETLKVQCVTTWI